MICVRECFCGGVVFKIHEFTIKLGNLYWEIYKKGPHRFEADGGDPEAVQALEAKQRAVLTGLLSFETSLELYTQAYLLCVRARKDINKDEIGKLLELLPPVVRHLSKLPVPKKYLKQKAHGGQQDVSKLLTLAFLSLEAHRVPEEPPQIQIGSIVEWSRRRLHRLGMIKVM